MSTASGPAQAPVPDPEAGQPTSVPVLKRIVVYGGVLALGIAVVGSVLGGIFAGGEGIAGALIGTAMAVGFMAITALSIIVANRVASGPSAVGTFFAIVLGGWLLKFVVFVVLLMVLQDAPWLNQYVLFGTIVAGVVGSLIVDMVVIAKGRIGHVSDVTLPPAPRDD